LNDKEIICTTWFEEGWGTERRKKYFNITPSTPEIFFSNFMVYRPNCFLDSREW